MSNLPGNPHAYNAEYGMTSTVLSSDDSGTQTIEALLMDNARATLALAYEQRTATLVHALLSDSLVTDGKYDEIQAEVRQRLGLGENNA